MRRPSRRGLAVAAAVLAVTPMTSWAGADAADRDLPAADSRANVQPWLAKRLENVAAARALTVMVHGTSADAATGAVEAAGMTLVTTFDRIGVAVATGTSGQVDAVRAEPGITYVEGNRPITMSTETSHQATRGSEAQQTLTGADGQPLTGNGVSVGIIDGGIDPTHPMFAEPDGGTAVVANLKVLCEPLTESACEVVSLPTSVDTDTTTLGGHGTHVSGIAAGRPVELTDGGKVSGAAPGAKIVSLSTGAALFIIGADAALNWVLENHAHPCGPDVPADVCPPIKVTNNSYGAGPGAFDPESATAKLQRALADEGVLTVWANGNDGGDGSANMSNPPGQDPTPGIISVASYYDEDTGTRDGVVSEFSSRGKDGELQTYPDISAPGENITSACRLYLPICMTGLDPRNGPGPLDLGTFNTISGTSMAAPHITGIVAQLFQAKPDATPAEIESALKLSAHQYSDGAAYEPDPGGGVTSYDKGHGLVDVVAAYELLTGG